MRYRADTVRRFWAKVDKSQGPSGCWPWMGAQDGHGYGHLTVDCKSKKAYRVAYELAHGPITPGFDVDHRCHNKICVNPLHLRAITHKQNGENLRGASRNSKTGIRGVSWHKQAGKWRVTAMHHYRQYYGGSFHDIEDAARAAVELRERLFTHSDMDHSKAA